MDQGDARTTEQSCLSQQDTHRPTAAIGERANTVQRLDRRTSRDQQGPSAPVAPQRI